VSFDFLDATILDPLLSKDPCAGGNLGNCCVTAATTPKTCFDSRLHDVRKLFSVFLYSHYSVPGEGVGIIQSSIAVGAKDAAFDKKDAGSIMGVANAGTRKKVKANQLVPCEVVSKDTGCWTNIVSTLLLLGIHSLNVLLAHSIAVNTSHRLFGYYKPGHTSPLLH
jgi:hypothetical protein